MADQLEELKKARSALVNERRTRARGIATSGAAITDSATFQPKMRGCDMLPHLR
jgi:hypothetical protein